MLPSLFKPLRAILAGTVVTVLVIAGCGGGEEATSTPAPKPPPAPTTAPAATATPTPIGPASPGIPTAAVRATPVPTATPPPAAPPPSAPGALKPKYGGVLTVRAHAAAGGNFDNYVAAGKFTVFITQNLLSNITVLDAEDGSTVRPDLAERWAYSPDGKSITYKFHRGVLWHDGAPFTAKDVVASLNRARDSTVHKANLAFVQSLEQPDDFTVRVNLSRPSASALGSLSVPFLSIYPAHVTIEAWHAKPFATGPFTLKGYQKGISYEFQRNDRYFKKDEAGQPLPYLDAVNTVVILDQALAYSAFLSGRLSCACAAGEVQVNQFPQIAASMRGAKLADYWVSNMLLFNTARGPLGNLKVRQAISIALDRRGLTDLVRGGGSFYPPTYFLPRERGGKISLSTEEVLRTPGFRQPNAEDLQLARQLFQEAGFDPSKTTFKLLHSTSIQEIAEAIAGLLNKAGVKVTIEILGSGSADLIAAQLRGDFDLTTNGGGNSFDDPADLITSSVGTGGALNYGKISSPKIDRLLAEQDIELDFAKRQGLLLELQRELLAVAAYVPINTFPSAVAVPPWVEGFAVKRAFTVSSAHRYERVWLNL